MIIKVVFLTLTLKSNSDWLLNGIINIIGILVIIFIKQLYENYKFNKSEEGKLEKKIKKRNKSITQISQIEKSDKTVNKDLFKAKKLELEKEIKKDIIEYQLNTNDEYIELEKLKKQGKIDNEAFHEAVENIKATFTNNRNNFEIIELDNGISLKVEPYSNMNLINAKLLNHIDKFENQLVKSGKSYFEIANNKIKNIFQERGYENGFLVAQKKSVISVNDRVLKPLKKFNYQFLRLMPNCAVRINDNIITQVYWIKKGKTLTNKVVEIYQKDSLNRSFGDLVFINSMKARNGLHLVLYFGSLLLFKTENGKIV